MKLTKSLAGWTLTHNDHVLLQETTTSPVLYLGRGEESVEMYRGNFKISDYLIQRTPLYAESIDLEGDTAVIEYDDLTMKITTEGDAAMITFDCQRPTANRIWIRVMADQDEHIYGCGEQMSYFNLRGRNYPLWTSEPGVGRDKSTYLTWLCDVHNGGGGGDYYNTNYPQATYVSSRCYYLHADCTAYADFDFRHDSFHELQFWAIPASIRIEAAEHFIPLLENLTAYLGRQPELPEWIYNGLILGLQGGKERVLGLLDKTLDHDIPVAGVWCQDWAGVRFTSFGKRLNWDWHANENLYPDLAGTIQDLHAKGIKYLGYINPYLVEGGDLFKEGLEKGVFAKRSDGSLYLVDFGEFYCGVIDFTDPDAYEWFKNRVIIEHSLDLGIDGWMADFGEYLPTDDIVLANGNSAMIEHNHWPALWAKCNYDALVDTGKLGDIFFFMRAGATGSQKYCVSLWNGDQSVDFTRHDGLCTTICGTLSAGMIGCGINHSDIGGYTSLFENRRTKELFLRWAEMAAFTPIMRTHEGNRPDENFQYYDDDDCMDQLARLVKIYTGLRPYIKDLVSENASHGTPVQRPLFLHYEEDARAYDEQFEYLLGPDLLVAPVWQSEQTTRTLYLPEDQWIHLWSGESYSGGEVTVDAPLGYTPVFYRKGSAYADLFRTVATIK